MIKATRLDSKCIVWQGAKTSYGYGSKQNNGKVLSNIQENEDITSYFKMAIFLRNL